MLLELPNVLSPQEIREVLTALDGGPFVEGGLAKRSADPSSAAPVHHDLGQRIKNRLMKHQMFLQAAMPKAITDIRFSRIEPGSTHGDRIHDAVISQEAGQPVRSDLAMTLFLSHPDDYDGGELVINSEIAPQPVKLPPGCAVIYPTTEFHRVQPVTRGVRRVAVCWIQSMVRQATQREILTEMWIAIGQMQKMLPPDQLDQNQAFRHLGKARVNLIRMWAEL